MATNPTTVMKTTLRDQSGEDSSFGVHLASPIDLDTLPASWTNFITAIDTEITNGLFVKYNQTTTRNIANTAEGGGNREDKLLMVYQDNVTLKVYTFEMPCRLPTLTTVGVGSDSVPPATWATTKTTFEAVAKSIDGNAVTLLDVRIVGRNI